MEKPPIQNSREVTSFALTSDAVRDFIKDLPERSVVVVMPYSTFELSISQVRKSLIGLSAEDYIYDTSRWYVASKLETANGWLRMTFGWRYWIYADSFSGSQFRELIGTDLCKMLDDHIGIAFAHFQSGLTLDNLASVMPGLHLSADRMQRVLPPNSLANRLLTDPIAVLTSALDLWRKDSGYLNTRFSGGGFGLLGAFRGMAIANTLNQFIDSQNDKVKSEHLEWLRLPLHYGFEQLRATQRIIQ